MKCFINGQEYKFIKDALKDNVTRMSYFKLTKQIYRLEFEKWYQPDYWDNRFIPYIIIHKDIVVSSVAVCINDISWQDQRKDMYKSVPLWLMKAQRLSISDLHRSQKRVTLLRNHRSRILICLY